MIFYFRSEKARLDRERVAEAAKGVGRPKVGGKFELVDHEGREFGDEDLKGGFTLVSSCLLQDSWMRNWKMRKEREIGTAVRYKKEESKGYSSRRMKLLSSKERNTHSHPHL